MSAETVQFDNINQLTQEVESREVNNPEELEAFRIAYLGSKNKLKSLFAEIKNIPNEDKKAYGQAVNALKQLAESKFNEYKTRFEQEASDVSDTLDLSLPGAPVELGARHPYTLVRNQIIEIFVRMGYSVHEGPEVEDDWHNFTALNFPPDHPARDMQDTYFVNKDPDFMLRTHTSSVQVRVMESQQPPIRAIFPGRVYRNETISARSHCFFHQVEGLYIDKGVSFADLKETLYHYAREMFGKTRVRFRPSYFPFTEPSAEMDIYWGLETEVDRKMTKGTGWLEILGCGMVDPAVLANCNIDPEIYTGFAFGIGIDRATLQRYHINDIRLLSENDVRFLQQFKSAF